MRIYSRNEPRPYWSKATDTITIYAATLYPILWWHLTPDRNFNWFIDGDFLQHELAGLKPILADTYLTVLTVYFLKEIWFSYRLRWFNWPRNLFIFGTVVFWYFGIVEFNGDLAFTMLNVVSHGIPYMALIWVNDRPKPILRSIPGYFEHKIGLFFSVCWLFWPILKKAFGMDSYGANMLRYSGGFRTYRP